MRELRNRKGFLGLEFMLRWLAFGLGALFLIWGITATGIVRIIIGIIVLYIGIRWDHIGFIKDTKAKVQKGAETALAVETGGASEAVMGSGMMEEGSIQQGSKVMNAQAKKAGGEELPSAGEAYHATEGEKIINEHHKNIEHWNKEIETYERRRDDFANQAEAAEEQGDTRTANWYKKKAEEAEKRVEEAVQRRKQEHEELRSMQRERFEMDKEEHEVKIKSMKSSLWGFLKICGIIFIILLIGIALFYPGGASPQMRINNFMIDMSTVFGNVFQGLIDALLQAGGYLMSRIIPNEAAGVPILNPFKYRTCEPFCTPDTGDKTGWHGFEITDLSVFPRTTYDYQPLSVIVEFTNNGNAEAEVELDASPSFGCSGGLVSTEEGKIECTWSPERFIWSGFDPDEAQKCKEVCPIAPNQDTTLTVTGKCLDTEKTEDPVKSPCTLEPGELTQLRWYGIMPNADNDVLPKSAILQPTIWVRYKYDFKPSTDLTGAIVVQSQQEAVSASEISKEGRIINKISQSYSPTGPLMMAMGTAEEQVISGYPTLFILQFANKGRGTVEKIEKESIKLYLPEGFEIYDESLCNFEEEGTVAQLMDEQDPVFTKEEKELWNPGLPYTEENYVIYGATEDISDLQKSANPNDNPLLSCMLDTPKDQELNTYDIKVRLLEYSYSEEGNTKVKMIGTDREVPELQSWKKPGEWSKGDSYDFTSGEFCEGTEKNCMYKGDIFFKDNHEGSNKIGDIIWATQEEGKIYNAGNDETVDCSEVPVESYEGYQEDAYVYAGDYVCINTRDESYVLMEYKDVNPNSRFEWEFQEETETVSEETTGTCEEFCAEMNIAGHCSDKIEGTSTDQCITSNKEMSSNSDECEKGIFDCTDEEYCVCSPEELLQTT